MKEKSINRMIKKGSQRMIQQNLFGVPDNRLKRSKFISIFRIDPRIENLAYQPGTVACKQPHGQPVFTNVK